MRVFVSKTVQMLKSTTDLLIQLRVTYYCYSICAALMTVGIKFESITLI